MEVKEVLVRSLNESWTYLTEATDGLTQEEIAWSPAPHCNSLAFILWHVARVEDIWIGPVIQHSAGVYLTQNWQERLGIPVEETGFGYNEEQLLAWPVPRLEDLCEYAQAVRENTLAFLETLAPEKLLEVPRADHPGETTGMILAHLITEIALHVGQIDYLRGVHRGLDTPHAGHWR
ncbi:MAG TPA: DUF664 domain-containing protein [Dehalococcoidia bacterium]|nr:DUF664 domain-containing protein [Dehalococcoidia bacterium]